MSAVQRTSRRAASSWQKIDGPPIARVVIERGRLAQAGDEEEPEALPQMDESGERAWPADLVPDHDNLRAVLENMFRLGETQLLKRLVTVVWESGLSLAIGAHAAALGTPPDPLDSIPSFDAIQRATKENPCIVHEGRGEAPQVAQDARHVLLRKTYGSARHTCYMARGCCHRRPTPVASRGPCASILTHARVTVASSAASAVAVAACAVA
jgi:hypothetical protein